MGFSFTGVSVDYSSYQSWILQQRGTVDPIIKDNMHCRDVSSKTEEIKSLFSLGKSLKLLDLAVLARQKI